MENLKSDYISVINSILLLIDYQPNLIKAVESDDRSGIINSAVASAKAASILHVPVVLTSSNETVNGIFIKEITDLLDMNKVISRSTSNPDVFEEEKVLQAIRKSGREKLIISGIMTSGTFVASAIRGIREGYDVYGLIDAGGDISSAAHNKAVQHMRSAGVTPVKWMSLTAEWMNGESTPSDGYVNVYGKYAAMLTYLSCKRPVVHL